MELRHLRYFVAVAEEASFTRAAARLRVAQPALSRQVKDLEDELDTPLFERGHAGVQLTRAGKVFHGRARALLAEAREAADEARAASGQVTGTLTLGFPSGLHLNYLVPAIDAMRKACPRVEFEFEPSPPGASIKALRDGRMDVAFVTLPVPLEQLEHLVVWRVPFGVVLPRKHALARRRSFALDDLRGEDFVFTTREARPEFYDEFFRLCANAGFRPRVVKEIGGYPTNILALVSVGLGLSVLPFFERAERIQGIVYRPLASPRLWWDAALVWRPPTATVVEQFLAQCRRLFPVETESARAEV